MGADIEQRRAVMEITKEIRYIGVNDHEIDLFEGQYAVPNGMAYNSYVIVDEKTAENICRPAFQNKKGKTSRPLFGFALRFLCLSMYKRLLPACNIYVLFVCLCNFTVV